MRSQEEITRFAAHWLEQRYGDRVAVEFSDVNRPEVAAALSGIGLAVDSRRMRLPVVTIDGAIARIEWFSAWALIDAVESYLTSSASQR